MIIDNQPELLGWGWLTEMSNYMKRAGKGTVAGKNINETLVKTLHKQYLVIMSKGVSPPNYISKGGFVVKWDKKVYPIAKRIMSVVGTSLIKTLNFLQGLKHLSSTGKIPFRKYDPMMAKKTKLALKEAKGPGVFEKFVGSKFATGLGGTLKLLPIAVISIAALGIIYLVKEKK